MTEPSLLELAQCISSGVSKLDKYFDAELFEFRFPQALPGDEQNALVGKTLEATLKLHRMLLGPFGHILSMRDSGFDLASLHVIYKFNIAQCVPEEGTATFEEISERCGLPTTSVRRILRHAMTNSIFEEVRDGAVSHTIHSRRLAQDSLIRSSVGMLCDEQVPAIGSFAQAFQSFRHPGGKTLTAWGLANGASRPMIEELQTNHPERAKTFSEFMRHNWSKQNPIEPLIENYDWASLGKVQIVDVGGGLGHVCFALARAFPSLSFIVQDFESVIEQGQREIPLDIKDRVEFMRHDFFHAQPVRGAAVYLFRSIFHDWPDEACVKILKALVPGLEEGSRVLLNDYCMPGPGELPFVEERRARTLDLVMTSLFNGRERESNEWEPLFRMADSRYHFQGVRPNIVNNTSIPTKKLMSVMEAIWTTSDPKAVD